MHFQCFEWRFECVLMSLISPRSNHLDFVWKLIVSGNCVFSALLWSCVRSGILPLRRANDIYWCKYFLEIHCHWILRSRRCHYQSPWLCFANKSTVITNLVLIRWYGEEKNFNWTRGLNSKNINASNEASHSQELPANSWKEFSLWNPFGGRCEYLFENVYAITIYLD